MLDAKHPVIVLGGGEANGLGIARALGSHGIPVYCLTSNPDEIMRVSRYCQGSQIVPRVEEDPAILSAWFLSKRRYWPHKPVVFATTDTALLTLARLQDEIASHYVPVIPRCELVETMVIKSRFYNSLIAHDVPHPHTFSPTKELGRNMPEVEYPVFLRPVQSLPFFTQFGVKGFIAQNQDTFRKYLHLVQSRGLTVLVQEIVPGSARHGYLLRGYFNQQSQPVALLATQKLRQPDMFATNTGLVSIPLTHFQEGVSMVQQYFKAIGYSGLFGAEFKRDPRDGVLKLLEINARSQGGNNVGAVCGVNHILAAYCDRLGKPAPSITEYRSGIYYSGLFLDAWSILQMARRHELHGYDLRDYLRPQQWNYLSRDDPRPFVKHLHRMVSKFIHSIHA